MAVKAIVQHHERTTIGDLLSDIQLREIGYASDIDYLIYEQADSTARYVLTMSTNAMSESGGVITFPNATTMTGAVSMSSTLDVNGGTVNIINSGGNSTLDLDASQTAVIAIDRGATTNDSIIQLQTAGVNDWVIGTGRQGTESNFSIDSYSGSWTQRFHINKSTGLITNYGAVTMSSTLGVTGLITASGGITIPTTKNLVMVSDSDILVNTDKFTVAGSTGNTVIGGTLGVTGAVTMSSTLGVADVITVTKDSGATVKLLTTINQHHEDATGAVQLETRLGYDSTSNRPGSYIETGKENTWTATASTRNGYLAFYTIGANSILERMRIASTGAITMSSTLTTASDIAITNGDMTITKTADENCSLTLDSPVGRNAKMTFYAGTGDPWDIIADDSSDNLSFYVDNGLVAHFDPSKNLTLAEDLILADEKTITMGGTVLYGDTNSNLETFVIDLSSAGCEAVLSVLGDGGRNLINAKNSNGSGDIGLTVSNTTDNDGMTVYGGISATGEIATSTTVLAESHVTSQSRLYSIGVGDDPSSANLEAVYLQHTGTEASLKVIKVGTGTARDFVLYTNDVERLRVNASGNVLVTGSSYENGTFAEIHVHDASAAQSIAAGATYTKLTAFTDNGQSSNCTADVTNDKITITKTGRYLVNGSFQFTGASNNITWYMASFLNGVEQDQCHLLRKIGTGGDKGSASFSGIIDVTTASWDLDVRARHDDAGSAENITINYANLNVVYLGET